MTIYYKRNVIYLVQIWFEDEAFTEISIFSTLHRQLAEVFSSFNCCVYEAA